MWCLDDETQQGPKGAVAADKVVNGGHKKRQTLPETLPEVCAIGVTAEIDNARLYDEELLPAVAAFDDITTVFKALSAASTNNHLPAFQRCAGGNG